MLVAAAGAAVVACGGSRTATAPAAPVSSRCPDLTKADELASFDFAKEYALTRDAADKLKAAALAAMEISLLSEKLDAEFGIACAQIAHDLGAKGDWRSGSEACAAAIKAVRDARAKLGAKTPPLLVVRTPICQVSASLMTQCASICDSSVQADRVKADCERKAGRCDGNCDGVCESKSTKCDGTCSGTCDGPIRGRCGGRCRGTCDGKPMGHHGTCAGVCVGTCERSAMQGECRGKCSGSCEAKVPGICDGLCSGACTVELTDVKCAGEFKTPEVSTDCLARCELAVINQKECSTPHVGVVLQTTGDRADHLKVAIDKSFPALLKILFEVGDKAGSRVLTAQAVLDSARGGFGEMARSGGKSTARVAEAQLLKCFDEPFKKAAATAAAVKTSLDQADAVRNEALR